MNWLRSKQFSNNNNDDIDYNDNPLTSIALPFQNESLYSLFTENSAFILVKYYKAGYGCMSSPREKRGGVTKGNVNKFIKQFEDWLNEAVSNLFIY